MGLIAGLTRLFDRYDEWYDREIAPKRFQARFPKCIFCGDRNYSLGTRTLYNSRVMSARVRATVTCETCGMRYQGSRYPDSKNWSFDIST